MSENIIRVPVTLRVAPDRAAVRLAVSSSQQVEMALGYTVEISGRPYTGRTEYTPSDETQIVEIAGLTAQRNITINPIPSNYGRIAYDGSIITIY